MPETRRRFDPEFRQGAVRIVREPGKPVAQVARELGSVNRILGNWVKQDKVGRGETEALTSSSPAQQAGLRRHRQDDHCEGRGVGGLLWAVPPVRSRLRPPASRQVSGALG
jgi:transposase